MLFLIYFFCKTWVTPHLRLSQIYICPVAQTTAWLLDVYKHWRIKTRHSNVLPKALLSTLKALARKQDLWISCQPLLNWEVRWNLDWPCCCAQGEACRARTDGSSTGAWLRSDLLLPITLLQLHETMQLKNECPLLSAWIRIIWTHCPSCIN